MIGYFTINSFLLTVFLALMFSFQALAGNENMSNRITGGEIEVDQAVLTVADQFFPDIEDGCRVKQANGRVILGVDHAIAGPVSLFSVKLTVHYSDRAGNFAVMADQWLLVDAARDRDVLYFPDAVYISVDIEEVSGTVPDYVFIQGEVETERYYDLNRTLIPFSDGGLEHALTAGNELEIFWNYIPGAEEYELEYTYIDNYDSDGSEIAAAVLNWSFEFNSTRIRLVDNYYKFPLLYDKGYILYRVRPIGRGGVELNKDVFGRWSSDQFSGTLVSTFLHKYQITGFQNLNYQLGITFSENGKRKDIVNYFDGSLRGRQTLTRSNSNEKIIIADKIYDYEGRPAITTLPAPVVDPNAPKTLDFYSKFTTNMTGDKYGQPDFDTGEGCDANAAPMNSQSGAALYYSPDNPVNTGHHAYIPDAEGYPFSRTEYEPDNTGRIRRQGGLGPVFQLKGDGTGRETRYYYGHPEQEQLDRLFGNDVGYAGYYKKNMVMDANRQVSVSYLDQAGNVVATALAGENPANMETTNDAPLSSVSIVAIDECPEGNGCNKNNTRSEDALVFTKKLLVTSAGNYVFNYEITPEEVGACENVCFDCVYRLRMSITDECGELVKVSSSSSQPINAVNEVVGTIGSLTCDGSAPKHTRAPISCYLPVGSYTLAKTLKVDAEKMEEYVQHRIETCLNPLDDFMLEEERKVDMANACEEVTCHSCLSSLRYQNIRDLSANYNDYKLNGNYQYVMTIEEYEAAIESCKELCNEVSNCQASYNMMLSDMSPGGQYGAVSDMSDGWNLSIFNPDNWLPRNRKGSLGSAPSWRKPDRYYKNEDGDTAYIQLIPLGIDNILLEAVVNEDLSVYDNIEAHDFLPSLNNDGFSFRAKVKRGYFNANNQFVANKYGDIFVTKPENLANFEDFRANWKPQWAEALVHYHPEYCYYQYCSGIDDLVFSSSEKYTSDMFDQRLYLIESFARASVQLPGNDPDFDPWFFNWALINTSATVVTDLLDRDPYFTKQSSLRTEMEARLLNYKTVEGQTLNVKQFVAMTVRCGSIYYFNGDTDPAYSPCLAFGTGEDVDIKDQEWEMYKMLYLSEKQKIWQREADKSCSMFSGSSYVGGINTCIGKKEFQPFYWHYIHARNNSYEYWTRYICDLVAFCQPCGWTTFKHYKDKTARFTRHEAQEELMGVCDDGTIDDEDRIAQAREKADLEHFLETGQCPETRDFGALLNQLAERDKLLTDNINLRNYPAFSKRLYDLIAFNGQPRPRFSTAYREQFWRVSAPSSGADTVRVFNINDTFNPEVICSLTIRSGQEIAYVGPDEYLYKIPVTYNTVNLAKFRPFPVDDTDTEDQETGTSRFLLKIAGIRNFFVTRVIEGGGNISNDFIASAIIEVYDISDPLEPELVHIDYDIRVYGTVRNIPLGDCDFQNVCTLSRTAKDLENLLSAIAASKHLKSASSISLTGDEVYKELYTSELRYFTHCGGGTEVTFDASVSGGSATIEIGASTVVELSPIGSFSGNYDDVLSFSCVKPNKLTPNEDDFLITAVVGVSGQIAFVDFEGVFLSCDPVNRPFRAEECGPPASERCRGQEYDNRRLIPGFLDHLVRDNINMNSSPVYPVDNNALKSTGDINVSNNRYVGKLFPGAVSYKWKVTSLANRILNAELCFLDGSQNCLPNPKKMTLDASDFPLGVQLQHIVAVTDDIKIDYSVREGNAYYRAEIVVVYQVPGSSVSNQKTTKLIMESDFPIASCEKECVAGRRNLVINGTFSDPTLPADQSPVVWQSGYTLGLDKNVPVTEAGIVRSPGKVNPDIWRHMGDFTSGEGYMMAVDAKDTITPCWYTEVSVEAGKLYEFSAYVSNIDLNSGIIIHPLNYKESENYGDYKNLKISPLSSGGGFGEDPRVRLYFLKENEEEDDERITVAVSDPVQVGRGWIRVSGWVEATYTGPLVIGVTGWVVEGITGPRDFGLDNISFMELCEPPVILPVVEEEEFNPCLEYLEALVELNAENAYKTYVDKHRNDFRQEYLNKCLSAKEKLSYDYEEKEHHYTLYYYDQAGNLVKTVPPAGVRPLDNAGLNQIREDRISNMHTLNLQPEHRMATTYSYNSLNQLLTQSLPDHMPMDIWESQDASSGIPASYTTRDVQFADGSRGWAIAVDENDPERRGRLLTTADGGNNWNELSKVGLTDITSVHFADSDHAYATGSKGELLYSADGGLSWLTLRTPSDKPLVGLYFNNDFPEEGRVYASDGTIYKTSSGGLNWSGPYTGLSSMLSGELKSLSFTDDGIYGTAISVQGDQTFVYQGSDNGETWAKISDYTTLPYNTIHMSSATEGFAAGDKGILVQTTDGGEIWRLIANNTRLDFRKIYFRNQVNGVAVLSDNKLYSTADGGRTWILHEDVSEKTIVDLGIASNNNNLSLLASDGKIYESIGGGSWEDKGQLSGFGTLYSVSVARHGNTTPVVYAGGSGGKVWIGGSSVSGPSGNVLGIHFSSSSNGCIIVDDGSSVRLHYTSNGGAFWTNVTPSGVGNVRAFHFRSASEGYAYTSTGKMLKTSNGGASWVETANKPATAGISDFWMIAEDQGLVVGGGNGFIEKGLTTGATGWGSKTITSLSGRLNGTFTAGTNAGMAYAVGDNGLVLRKKSASQWAIDAPTQKGDLYAVAGEVVSSQFQGLAVGKDRYSLQIMGASLISGPVTGLAADTDLKAVTLSASATYYAAGDAGRLYKFSAGAWTSQTYSTTHNFKAIDFVSSGKGLAVGASGTIVRFNVDNWININEVATRELNETCIIPGSTSIGFAVGNGGTILKTEAAGVSWKAQNSGTTTDLHGIAFASAENGLAVGLGGLVLRTTNGGQNWSKIASVASAGLHAVAVSGQAAIAVGSGGTIIRSTDGGATWTNETSSGLTTSHLRAVFMVDAATAYAVGDAGAMIRTRDGGDTWEPMLKGAGPERWTNENLYDVYFTNALNGYAVGAYGTFLKTVNKGDTWMNQDSKVPEGVDLQAIVGRGGGASIYAGGAGTMRALTDMSDRISGRFWYDELGRLVASQNTKQLKSNQYSYTVYDSQSRIVEVGQAERLVSPSVDNQVAYAAFTSWLTNAVKTEVTKTYYDKKLEDIAGFRQDNLRTRVASVTYQDEDNALYNGKSYQYATHYSYDPHGNVKSLIQENYQLAELGQELKRIDYSYDLVSGLVKEVAYQQGKADQFYHRYAYDADNRITEVHTSADGVLWDQDARYFYYDHGPLARTEIGELSVQGMDYAYTLQGWIKGINSNTLQASRDMGKDSQVGLNAVFAPDEFAYSLGYYDQDYKAINSIGGTHFLAGTDQSGFTGSGASLYNGNISHMVTAIGMLMANGPQAYAYSYDQLNRLRTVTAHADPNVMVVNNWASGSAIQDYSEDYQYDLNGNILRVKRNAAGAESNSAGTGMDDLEYVYETIANEYKRETNKLRRVIDHQTGSSLSEDFKPGQSPDNYDYDEIGNLIADEQEKIASIEWTVGGKIRKVVRKQEAGVGKPDLEFAYDASGNRIMKLEKPRVDGDLLPEHAWTYTYYVRDASGNVMRAYTKKYTEETSGYSVTYKATEAPVYGSSRLGLQTFRAEETLASRPFTATLSGGVFSGISYTADPTIEPASLSHAYSLRGVKQYELNDHLGNVKVVVSDKRNLTGEADVKSYSDYYAFGMQMPGRYANDGYRYGFNGKERDIVGLGGGGSTYDYGFRIYNPALGRFLSEDPLTKEFPYWTPYQYAGNTPIQAVDLDGLEIMFIHGTWSDPTTFNAEFKRNMIQATNWTDLGYHLEVKWSGGNSPDARLAASDKIVEYLTSVDNIEKTWLASGEAFHVTLIAHSHGGNVAKMTKNRLEEMGWTVDLINIETPQREDYQTNKTGKGVYLNFYNSFDLVQFFGTADNFITNPTNQGPEGSRRDPNAKNIGLDAYRNVNEVNGHQTIAAPAIWLGVGIQNSKDWVSDAAGHSMHENKRSSEQVITETKKAFNE